MDFECRRLRRGRRDFALEPFPSGIAQLDALLGGGLEGGTSTLLAGPAGTGKSSVALLFAAAAAQRGEGAVIYSFEEGRPTLLARAAALHIPLRDYLEGRLAPDAEILKAAV